MKFFFLISTLVLSPLAFADVCDGFRSHDMAHVYRCDKFEYIKDQRIDIPDPEYCVGLGQNDRGQFFELRVQRHRLSKNIRFYEGRHRNISPVNNWVEYFTLELEEERAIDDSTIIAQHFGDLNIRKGVRTMQNIWVEFRAWQRKLSIVNTIERPQRDLEPTVFEYELKCDQI